MALFGRGRKGRDNPLHVESVDVNWSPTAQRDLERMAEPFRHDSAVTIGQSIVAHVPVQQGVMVKSFRPRVDDEPDESKLYVGSPFWHWLEYGTATSPIYRPVQRGVEATGVRYEPA
jgi:hypothetical protein